MSSKMYKEIQDQYDVSINVLNSYLPQSIDFSKRILNKQKVFLMGTGASLNACRAAIHAFIKYSGIIPYVVAATEIDYFLDVMDNRTLVILVSQSGESYETKIACEKLKAKGAELWGITNNLNSVLAKSADQLLPMNAGEEVSSATKTYLASVLILYLLAAGENRNALKEIQLIPEDIKGTLKEMEGRIDSIAEKLLNEEQLYIVGLGTHGAAAFQGALLMKEKTFIFTEGLPISEFRHGTVEVVRSGLPIILSACGPAMLKDAVMHAEYLMKLGASVFLVVDHLINDTIIRQENIFHYINRSEEIFSHPVVSIFYQMLAERIASQKGYNVDSFRYLSKVVDQY